MCLTGQVPAPTSLGVPLTVATHGSRTPDDLPHDGLGLWER